MMKGFDKVSNAAANSGLLKAAKKAKQIESGDAGDDSGSPIDGKTENQKTGGTSPIDNKDQAPTSLDEPENAKGKASGTGGAKIKIPPKIKLAIAGGIFSVLGHVLIIVLVISIIYSVADVMKEVWDGILSFFTKDQVELESEYYDELRKVQKKKYDKEGVCIDVNLITAALIVDTTFEPDPNDPDEDPLDYNDPEADTETNSKKGALDYKRMKKQVEFLASMQIKHKKYGNDSRLTSGGGHCKPYTDEEASVELVDDSNKSFYRPLTTNAKDSSDPELVSQNDEGWFLSFFLKKADEEKNYEYNLYQPLAEYKCMPEGDPNCKYKEVCDDDPPENEAELSIGDPNNIMNTMKDGVFYWNLVHQFIEYYYDDYLPTDNEEAREKKINDIAESIFLLYKSMGPSHQCEEFEEEDDDDDTDCSYNVGLDSQELSNVYVRLLSCNDEGGGKDLGEPLVPLEEYVAGVVRVEDEGGPEEALKVQAVAARSYVLGRAKSEGKIIQEDGKTILLVRNCTEWQCYCSLTEGCWMKSRTIHSGVFPGTGKPAYVRYPLVSGNKYEQAARATRGQVLVDASGNIITTGYNSTRQNEWNAAANAGKNYETILMDTYSNAAKITSNCKSGGVSGDGTKCGIFTQHTCENYRIMDNRLKYWCRGSDGLQHCYNPGTAEGLWYKWWPAPTCTWYIWGRAMQTLIEDAGYSDAEAYDLMANKASLNSNAGGWYIRNANREIFDASSDWNDARPGAIIVFRHNKDEYSEMAGGHVAFVESVDKDENGNVISIHCTQGNWQSGTEFGKYCDEETWYYNSPYVVNEFDGFIFMIDESDLCDGANEGDWLYTPTDADDSPRPLIVMLQGNGHVTNGISGDGGKNLFDRYKSGDGKLGAYIYIPQMHSAPYDNEDIKSRILKVVSDPKNNIDTNKISLWGYSQGAVSVPILLSMMPNYFSSAVIMAGYSSDTTPFGNLPTYCFTGTTDTYKDSHSKTVKLCSSLPNGHLKIFEGKGHENLVENSLNVTDIDEGYSSIISWALSKSKQN